jgi:hypothetical protein
MFDFLPMEWIVPAGGVAALAAGAALVRRKALALFREGKDIYDSALRIQGLTRGSRADGSLSKEEAEGIGRELGTLAGEILEFRDACKRLF